MKKCVFCSIIKNNRPYHEIIWSDKNHIAFLDSYPMTRGHTLVIPKKHTDYLFDLKEKKYLSLFKASKKIATIIKNALKCKRVALVVEGFSVHHTHVHLIPLNRGEKLDELRLQKTNAKTLAQIAKLLRKD